MVLHVASRRFPLLLEAVVVAHGPSSRQRLAAACEVRVA